MVRKYCDDVSIVLNENMSVCPGRDLHLPERNTHTHIHTLNGLANNDIWTGNSTDPPKWLKYIAFLTYCLALVESGMYTHTHTPRIAHVLCISFAIASVLHIAYRGYDVVRVGCRYGQRPNGQWQKYTTAAAVPIHNHLRLRYGRFWWITFEMVFVRPERNEYSAFVKYVHD